MTKCLLPIGSAVVALGFTACSNMGSTANNPTGTGPFDDRGNYIEEWADNPSKWNGRSVPTPNTEPKPTQTTLVASNDTPTVAPRPSTPPRSTVINNPTPKPKPKPVVKPKPKPKPKPSATYYTVRKGDTLFGLAKKFGTSVSVIQRANGISGSTIRIGQKVKIPR